MNSIIQSKYEYYFEWPSIALNDKKAIDQYCFSSSTTCGIFGTKLERSNIRESESVAATANILTQFRIAFDHKDD